MSVATSHGEERSRSPCSYRSMELDEALELEVLEAQAPSSHDDHEDDDDDDEDDDAGGQRRRRQRRHRRRRHRHRHHHPNASGTGARLKGGGEAGGGGTDGAMEAGRRQASRPSGLRESLLTVLGKLVWRGGRHRSSPPPDYLRGFVPVGECAGSPPPHSASSVYPFLY